jgi:hypothetical protein
MHANLSEPQTERVTIFIISKKPLDKDRTENFILSKYSNSSDSTGPAPGPSRRWGPDPPQRRCKSSLHWITGRFAKLRFDVFGVAVRWVRCQAPARTQNSQRPRVRVAARAARPSDSSGLGWTPNLSPIIRVSADRNAELSDASVPGDPPCSSPRRLGRARAATSTPPASGPASQLEIPSRCHHCHGSTGKSPGQGGVEVVPKMFNIVNPPTVVVDDFQLHWHPGRVYTMGFRKLELEF